MNDLQAWKEALEKHGIKSEKKKAIDVLLVFGLGGEVLAVTDDDDDHTAAEFISRVTEKVFSPAALFVPCIANKEVVEYKLIDNFMPAYNCILANGPTKRGALLNALQTQEPK